MTDRVVWVCLLGLTAIRLAVASWLPLSPDEAYYWVWSRIPQAGYPDHPPMVAIWIRVGTTLLGQNALGVRLLGPLSALAGSWAIWSACRDLRLLAGRDPARAWIAPMLLNATLMIGLGGGLMTPDTPLAFFLALACLALTRVLSCPPGGGGGAWWLVMGAMFGCGFDAKYTALLPAAGLAGWLLASPAGRAWLRRPQPWGGVACAGVIMAPVLWWNADHAWVSLLRQGGRAGDWQPARAGQFLGELLGGQIGLATPAIAGAFVMAVWRARGSRYAAPFLWMAALPALVFIEHAIGARVQANWPVVMYPALAILAGCFLGRAVAAALSGYALTALVYLQATTHILPLSPHRDVTAREMAGWPTVARAIARVSGGRPVIVPDYGLASELAFYGAHPVIGQDARWQWFAVPPLAPDAGLLVARADEKPDPGWSPVAAQAPVCRLVRTQPIRCYRFYRTGMARSSGIPAIILPQR